jgi:hypothetical protein
VAGSRLREHPDGGFEKALRRSEQASLNLVAPPTPAAPVGENGRLLPRTKGGVMSTIVSGRAGRIVGVLAGLLLAATVLPAGSEPEAGAVPELEAGEAVEPRAWHTITVPAASFIPNKESLDYTNSGYSLTTDTGTSKFTATVPFPFPSVTVKRMTLYAHDNSTQHVCLWMYRAAPSAGTEVPMANVCSSGASTTIPRAFTDTSIVAPLVQGYTSAYLWLELPAGSMNFYGVTIKYTV